MTDSPILATEPPAMITDIPKIRPSRDTLGERMYRHGHNITRTSTPTYDSWSSMIQRCNNETNMAYFRYGGSGITVCQSWHTFSNFLADMGERPSRQYSLDRWPNRYGNYEPGNCRWATWKEQNRNRKSSRAVIRSDGKYYSSMGDAADDVAGYKNGIFATCVGKQKTHRGFGWRYAE